MADDGGGDLKPFKRGPGALLVSSYGRFSLGLETHTLAQLGYGLDPRSVPVAALQLMGTCPPVYLAERTISGIIRRPDLYSVIHDDPAIVAETEAWLWPLLDRLAASAARAFAYGSVADVLDWERKTLRIQVPTGEVDAEGRRLRNKSLVRHTHFSAVHEIHPDETLLDLDAAGEILRVHAHGTPYPYDRTAFWCWDSEFGSWAGQGARRRAWHDYCEWLIVTVLRDKYLERSVDAPRIAWVPDGKFTLEDGTEIANATHLVNLLEDLRGSGALALPSARYGQTDAKKYEIQQLELADRLEVWESALNRHESNMFISHLVAPQLQGLEDAASSGAGRTLDSNRRDNVEALALFAAAGFTRLVGIVHSKNHDPEKVAPPEVAVNDVGKAEAKKVMQEILRLATMSADGELALRTNMPVLLDQLNIPLRPVPPGWKPGQGTDAPTNGRPKNKSGGREERRENARTPDGEDDTGGDDQVREEDREERPA